MLKRYLRTRSGIAFDLENPEVDMVRIEDIATALAYMPRYNGHTGTTYSVAEHSVLVSRKCTERNRMWGLLHDAAEAYTGDIISPMKRLLPDFEEVETRIMNVICAQFDISKKCPAEVKDVDLRMLVTEKQLFFPEDASDWGTKVKPYDDVVIPVMKPNDARNFFLTEFFLIRKQLLEAV